MEGIPPTTGQGPGGHALPARFAGSPQAPGGSWQLAGSPTAPRRNRKKVVGSLLGALAAVVLACAFAVVQVSASLGFDAAEDRYDAAVAEAGPLQAELQSRSDQLSTTISSAEAILQNDSGRLVDATTKENLSGSVAAADEQAAEARTVLLETVPAPVRKPTWFWELFGATEQMEDTRDDVLSLNSALEGTASEVSTAAASVDEAGTAALQAAASAAAGFEAAHLSARNDAVIALRDAASEASTIDTIDDYAVDAFVALEGAATQVVDTENAELAEKAGPLLGQRLAVEAFARSLAPGVLLEFDWAPIVNGYGYGQSMGGYASWWWDEPDRSVIQLSDSVAAYWPSAESQALVAHEVGHAISTKCEDMYDASTQESVEAWATAWAISMGFTSDYNGVQAYGYPPQSYIDAAAGCR